MSHRIEKRRKPVCSIAFIEKGEASTEGEIYEPITVSADGSANRL